MYKRQEHDSPFWPQVNTCVYKEVWIKPSLHWIWISAKTQGGATLSGVLPDPSEPIVLESRLSGRKIMLAAQNETGYFEKELPAGEYMVSCKGKSAPLTLLPGQKRRLSFPLYHADVSAVEENGILSIRAVPVSYTHLECCRGETGKADFTGRPGRGALLFGFVFSYAGSDCL